MTYKGYVQNSPKHEFTDIYFYLAIYIAKCIVRADASNMHVYPVELEMTDMQHIPISHVCSLDKSESKDIITDKKL